MEVLAPADAVDVGGEDADAVADEERLDLGVVEVGLLDVELVDLGVGEGVGRVEAREDGVDAGDLALEREPERGDRALHPLEEVDAHEVDERVLAVGLAEDGLAAADGLAVLGVVGGALVGEDVAERGVGGEAEPPDLVVDLADGGEAVEEVDGGRRLTGGRRVGNRPVSSVP